MQPHVPDLPRVEESVQQPEDSEDSEDSQDSQDVEPEQDSMNMDKKLSDDEVVKQFRGRSLSQKLRIFKRVLRQSHQSFILLVKTWIEDTAGDDRGRLRQGKAKQLLDLIWDDEDGLLPLFEKTETFQERVATSTVKIIRSELSMPSKEVKTFGKFDSSANLEAFDLR
jgi:hypothetical protein